uniref:Uncharacterized protein n=1 Tax=Pararge aegeria TaxID=116150 RepID=S4PWA5_9NEOP
MNVRLTTLTQDITLSAKCGFLEKVNVGTKSHIWHCDPIEIRNEFYVMRLGHTKIRSILLFGYSDTGY